MRKRILIHFVQLLTAAIAVTTVLMALLTYSMFEQRVMKDLRVDARVLRVMLETGASAQRLDALGGELRVTIIGADGSVAYDNRADSGAMESHMDRPEVRAAMERGEGMDVRNSKTVDRSAFYFAARLEDGRVLRVAKEASSIWSVYMRAVPLMLLVMAAMVGLSAMAANMLTRRLIRPIEQMAQEMQDTQAALESVPYPELRPVLHRIRAQHEEIVRGAQMRVEFTANVSHELKTPLTSISGYAELIENGMAKEEQAARFASEIRRSADRLLQLINDIIRLSQMDSPKMEPELEEMDLAEAVRAAAAQLMGSAQAMDVALSVDARPSMVMADRRMMEELAHNLMDNAIRYNVRGGSVQVEVKPVRDRVMLSVQDTGIGIRRENQERVFERFYRVDKSRSKATGGTGLGLAIVKHIAAKHHADICLESEPGEGTTVTVSFARLRTDA